MRLLFCLLLGTILTAAVVGVLAYTPTPPLICTLRSDAVAVVAAACQLVVDCRYELGSGVNALPLTSWDVLLTVQSALLSDSATAVLQMDARRYFIPEWYMTLPLMAYDDTSMDAVDCAPIAAAPQTELTAAVFELLDALSKYQRYVSDAAKCADVNQVALWSNATGTPTIVCQCAPGKICALGKETSDTLLEVAAIFVVVIALIYTAYSIIYSAYTLHHSRQLLHTLRRHGTATGRTSKKSAPVSENASLTGLAVALYATDTNSVELSSF